MYKTHIFHKTVEIFLLLIIKCDFDIVFSSACVKFAYLTFAQGSICYIKFIFTCLPCEKNKQTLNIQKCNPFKMVYRSSSSNPEPLPCPNYVRSPIWIVFLECRDNPIYGWFKYPVLIHILRFLECRHGPMDKFHFFRSFFITAINVLSIDPFFPKIRDQIG